MFFLKRPRQKQKRGVKRQFSPNASPKESKKRRLSRKKKEARKHETDQQQEQRLQYERNARSIARSQENEEDYQQRLQNEHNTRVIARSQQNDKEYQERLKQDSNAHFASRHVPSENNFFNNGNIEDFNEKFDEDDDIRAQHYAGRRNITCDKCFAEMFYDERLKSSTNTQNKFGLCCLQGKIQLPSLPVPPTELKQLYEGVDQIAKYFNDKIRSFNSLFAMSSIGVNQEQFHGNGPPIFKIQGVVHHKIGSLLPSYNQNPKFMQIYFYDTDDEINYRLERAVQINIKKEYVFLCAIMDDLKMITMCTQKILYIKRYCKNKILILIV